MIFTDTTVLVINLVGAAVVGEREHGTFEDSLVKPERPSEIALVQRKRDPAGGQAVVATGCARLAVPVADSVALLSLDVALPPSAVTSPVISMVTAASSVPQFVLLANSVSALLSHGADIEIVWPQLLAVAVAGAMFLVIALTRFRTMLARQA